MVCDRMAREAGGLYVARHIEPLLEAVAGLAESIAFAESEGRRGSNFVYLRSAPFAVKGPVAHCVMPVVLGGEATGHSLQPGLVAHLDSPTLDYHVETLDDVTAGGDGVMRIGREIFGFALTRTRAEV